MKDKITRQKELIALMKKEAEAYYLKDSPIVSDREYDRQFDELSKLEEETGVIFSDSPTQKVMGGILTSLEKVVLSRPALSSAKTKSVDEVVLFAKKAISCHDSRVIVSWKADGLTLVLRYSNHVLVRALTRGDGITGEDVTHTVKMMRNIPLRIPYEGEVEIRGEGVISWEAFRDLNEILPEPYAHPRNLASGSVRQLNANEAKNRNVEFLAFELLEPVTNTKLEQLQHMETYGFHVLDYELTDIESLPRVIEKFDPQSYNYPTDGLMIEYNDTHFGRSLGGTEHHEHIRIALKWEDETAETVFRGVDLQTTRTGRVSLTALFDPVTIDGTIVSRATLHNLTFFKDLKLGEGDIIEVYKANKIIPAIEKNQTQSASYKLSDTCPCCSSVLEIKMPLASEFLYCPNDTCPARQVKRFSHFVSRRAFNIMGLSDATLEKFISKGFIKNFADIFKLKRYEEEIKEMEGFGEKSYERLQNSIDKSKNISLSSLLYAFGIPMVGRVAAKTLENTFKNPNALTEAFENGFDFSTLEGFGGKISENIKNFLSNTKEMNEFFEVCDEIRLIAPPPEDVIEEGNPLVGKTIVVTGTLKSFTRAEIEEKIVSLGGKSGNTVSKKTGYVVYGEKAGSKLEKAKALNIPLLTEDEFIALSESFNTHPLP